MWEGKKRGGYVGVFLYIQIDLKYNNRHMPTISYPNNPPTNPAQHPQTPHPMLPPPTQKQANDQPQNKIKSITIFPRTHIELGSIYVWYGIKQLLKISIRVIRIVMDAYNNVEEGRKEEELDLGWRERVSRVRGRMGWWGMG